RIASWLTRARHGPALPDPYRHSRPEHQVVAAAARAGNDILLAVHRDDTIVEVDLAVGDAEIEVHARRKPNQSSAPDVDLRAAGTDLDTDVVEIGRLGEPREPGGDVWRPRCTADIEHIARLDEHSRYGGVDSAELVAHVHLVRRTLISDADRQRARCVAELGLEPSSRRHPLVGVTRRRHADDGDLARDRL